MKLIETLVFLFLGTLALSACNTVREKQTFKDSIGVFYPITKVGEGVSMLGEGLQTLSKPKSWYSSRPDKTSGDLSKEQNEFLETVSVKYDFEKSFNQLEYLSAGSYSFGPPVRDMLLTIENTVGCQFDWRLSPMLQDVAAAFPGGVIVINPNVMRSISVPAQFLFLFHEAGHQLLGHTSQIGTVTAMSQPWLTPAREQQADAFAGSSMRSAGFSAQDIVYGAMDAFKANPPQGTTHHPPRDVRIMTVRQAAGA